MPNVQGFASCWQMATNHKVGTLSLVQFFTLASTASPSGTRRDLLAYLFLQNKHTFYFAIPVRKHSCNEDNWLGPICKCGRGQSSLWYLFSGKLTWEEASFPMKSGSGGDTSGVSFQQLSSTQHAPCANQGNWSKSGTVPSVTIIQNSTDNPSLGTWINTWLPLPLQLQTKYSLGVLQGLCSSPLFCVGFFGDRVLTIGLC